MEKKPNVLPTNEQRVQVSDDYRAKSEVVINKIFENSIEPGVSSEYEKSVQIIRENALRQKAEHEERLRIEAEQKAINKQVQQPSKNVQDFGKNPVIIEADYDDISQPNYNAPFDVLPLPSQGKLYKSKKANIRVSYLTTADENILTSPNLLNTGKFMEVLINRKILESDLRYKDLLPGDLYAIMIWLRATSYGEMYPATFLDEFNEPFETEIDLSLLKTKKMEIDPDEQGLFSFIMPLSKTKIRFRLLTVRDINNIEKILEKEKEAGILVNNNVTYSIESMIMEVDGSTDRNTIREYSNNIRISDYSKFNQYVESINPGIDLNIAIKTPGGGSVDTFLPFGTDFFWPNPRV